MADALAAAKAASWGVCYHVQQAVGKALKALVVAAGEDPPRTHNLVRLNAAVDPPVLGASDEDALAALTVWSVEQRYPADQPEPTDSDAADALDFDRRAVGAIERRLYEQDL